MAFTAFVLAALPAALDVPPATTMPQGGIEVPAASTIDVYAKTALSKLDTTSEPKVLANPADPEIGEQADPSPYLLGNWGGLRDWLNARGIRPSVSLNAEISMNLNSGSSKTPRYADTRAFGASIDTPNPIGSDSGEIRVTLTWKNGQEISGRNELGILQYPTSIYGRGTIWRLTQAWYRAASGPWEIKLGRLGVGEDFATAGCEFQSLYFCGSAPGQIAHTVWQNYPVGQWGVRFRRTLGAEFYLQTGAYHVSPRNSDTQTGGFYLGFKGGGALVPVELGWKPSFANGLSGTYKIGLYASSANVPDVVLDHNHELAYFTAEDALIHHETLGYFANVRQQIRTAEPEGHGATVVFANLAFTDGRTMQWVSKIVAGIVQAGPFARRPDDEAGFAIGRVGVNRRLRALQEARNEQDPGSVDVQYAEYVAELFYGVQVFRGLMVKPNVQFVHHPGGVRDKPDIVLLGLKTVASF